MKRIGIDCRLWQETGIGRYTRNLIEQVQQDTENHYFLFTLPKYYEEVRLFVTNNNFTVVALDIHWHSWAEQVLMPLKLMDYRLDLMHFTYLSFPCLYPRKFIITIHDMIPWLFATGEASTLPKPFYWVKQFAYRMEMLIGARRSAGIIAVSYAIKDDVKRYLHVPDEKITVTVEGVTNLGPLTKPSKSDELPFDLTPKSYFLTVGNFFPHKNLQRLLLAFGKISALNNEVKLVMVGKKNAFQRRLSQFIQEHAIQNVVFTDFAPDNVLQRLYLNSIATVTPSLAEGFGLPPLEAIANNSLAIVSRIPALREVCGDNAIYADPESIENIHTALEYVLSLSSQKRTSLLLKAREQLKGYSWKEMGKQTLAVYNRYL